MVTCNSLLNLLNFSRLRCTLSSGKETKSDHASVIEGTEDNTQPGVSPLRQTNRTISQSLDLGNLSNSLSAGNYEGENNDLSDGLFSM